MPKKARPASGPKLIVGPPSAERRKWINLGMALFLASQVAIPLTYYLYKEPTNERFAWRMFSSIHMSKWSTRIVESSRRGDQILQQIVPVEELLVESSWQNLHAAHPDYRDRFLEHYLAESGADELRYEALGVWPSGKPMPPVRAVLERGGVVQTVD